MLKCLLLLLTLWAVNDRWSHANVTSTKSSSSRKCRNEVNIDDWKSFHFKAYCWSDGVGDEISILELWFVSCVYIVAPSNYFFSLSRLFRIVVWSDDGWRLILINCKNCFYVLSSVDNFSPLSSLSSSLVVVVVVVVKEKKNTMENQKQKQHFYCEKSQTAPQTFVSTLFGLAAEIIFTISNWY